MVNIKFKDFLSANLSCEHSNHTYQSMKSLLSKIDQADPPFVIKFINYNFRNISSNYNYSLYN